MDANQQQAKPRAGREWWDRFCALPRFSFWRGEKGDGTVMRLLDPSGDWVEADKVGALAEIADGHTNDLRNSLAAFEGLGEIGRNTLLLHRQMGKVTVGPTIEEAIVLELQAIHPTGEPVVRHPDGRTFVLSWADIGCLAALAFDRDEKAQQTTQENPL